MTDGEIAELKYFIRQLMWKSVDRDNMEFEVRTTCYVKDLLDKFALTPDKGGTP